jgi:hypothetical protein
MVFARCENLASAPRKKQYDSDEEYKTDDGPCYDAVDKEGVQDFEAEEAVSESGDDDEVKTSSNSSIMIRNEAIIIIKKKAATLIRRLYCT